MKRVSYKQLYLRYAYQTFAFIVVLCFGATSFYFLEKKYTRYNEARPYREELKKNFSTNNNVSLYQLNNLLDQLDALKDDKKPMKYDEALTYTVSVMYTIGWGNILVYSAESKIFLLVYACLSMPITTAMVITAGKIINKHLKDLIYKVLKLTKWRKLQKKNLLHYYSDILLIPLNVILFILFLTTNAFVLIRLQNFTYIDSVYYIFTTVTTIGFGDLNLDQMILEQDFKKKIAYHIYSHFSTTIGMSFLSAIINSILSLPKVLRKELKKKQNTSKNSKVQKSNDNSKETVDN